NIGIAACTMTLLGCCGPASLGQSFTKSATAGERRIVRTVPSIPPSMRVLLDPLPEPKCTATDTTVDERQKPDYERQCYRQAQLIARDRLNRLQKAVTDLDRPR